MEAEPLLGRCGCDEVGGIGEPFNVDALRVPEMEEVSWAPEPVVSPEMWLDHQRR